MKKYQISTTTTLNIQTTVGEYYSLNARMKRLGFQNDNMCTVPDDGDDGDPHLLIMSRLAETGVDLNREVKELLQGVQQVDKKENLYIPKGKQ
jgi:hypothetical protein